MNSETYEQAKKQMEEIATILNDEDLSPEERQKFESIHSMLAGSLMSP